MTQRQTETRTDPATEASSPGRSSLRIRASTTSALALRRVAPPSHADVEERYVTARNAWTAAMKAANSGKAADLAALAIAQEAYEAAAAERERWESGMRIAIPIEPESAEHRDLGAVVGQELAWRRVRAVEERPDGLLGRLRRRLRGG